MLYRFYNPSATHNAHTLFGGRGFDTPQHPPNGVHVVGGGGCTQFSGGGVKTPPAGGGVDNSLAAPTLGSFDYKADLA